MPDPGAEADLYEVDPAQFTDTRNALAKRLRAEGQREEAALVAKLRRPPVTAWALNQVARHRPELVRAVLDTGNRLRSAMTNAVGGDASGLHDAQAAQRRAVDAAVAAAAERLDQAGHPGNDANKQRMVATLGAAIVDDAVAGRLREGTLDGDRSAPGFGLDATSVPARSTARPAARRENAHADQAEEPPRRPEVSTADRERRKQERIRHAELQTKADRLTRRAERLQKHADEAERQATEARKAADEAQAVAARAQSQADKARPDED